MQEETISSQTLLRARACDNDAWRKINRVYRDRIYRQSLRSGLDPQAAAELTFTVLSRAFEKLPQFARDKSGYGLGRWLNTMTYRMIVDAARRRKEAHQQLHDVDIPADSAGRHTPSLIPDGRDPADSFDDSSPQQRLTPEKAALAAAIAELEDAYMRQKKEHHWTCFWMVKVEGLSGPEVARQLNLSTSHVTTICTRVKQRLQKLVQQKLKEMGDADSPDDPDGL